MSDLSGLGLFDALNFCEFTLAYGVVQIDSPGCSGRIHVHDGDITFAETSDASEGVADVEGAGIPVEVWQSVATDPQARGSVPSALIDRGVDPAAVRRFVRRRVERVVARLALETDHRVSTVPDGGWFGNEIGVPISVVIQSARVINYGGELVGDQTGDALIAVTPSDEATIVLGGDHWAAIAELLGATSLGALREKLGGRRAVELVRFLQSRGLASVVLGRAEREAADTGE